MVIDQTRARFSRRSLVAGATAAAMLTRGGRVRAAQANQVELRWARISSSQVETELWQRHADAVSEAYPNIKVGMEVSAFAEHWDKLQTQLASGTEPDIIQIQSLRMPAFAVRDAFKPLTPVMEQDPEFNIADFFPAIVDGLSVGGDAYALAFDVGPIHLYYNRDLFAAKGVPLPSPTEPMTWEAFRDAATRLTDAEAGQYGYAIQPGIDAVVPWLWSGGGDYMNAEETTCTLDAPDALAALDFVVGLVRDEIAVPVTDLANPNFSREAFYSGKVAMTQDGPWNILNTRTNAAFGWDIAPMPRGKAGSVTWVAGSGYGLSNTTEHPEEAWQALKVLTGTETLTAMTAAGRGYPARMSAVPAFAAPDAPPQNVGLVEAILTGQVGEARFFKTTTTWQETAVMLTQTFNPLFLGDRDVEETIARVKPEFDELLEKHQDLLAR